MNHWGFTLNNVTASWSEKDQNILERINFEFHIRDTKTAALPLMGPSGQGKSTLLYLLAALKLPSEGTVTWHFLNDSNSYSFSNRTNDKKHTEERVQFCRDRFGFAFQASTLSEHLTVRENIAYPLLLQGEKWHNALEIAESRFVDEFLLENETANETEKQRLLNAFPSELSGGQCQRAALAQAIIHNPYVLFADEPTGQLDLGTRKQVMRVLKQWLEKGQGQRALIWVTHHHIDDLNLMDVDDLLFIENKQCTQQNRGWLNNWISDKK